jgi:hypothetical protein
MRPDKGKNKSVGIKPELTADDHERRSIRNFIALMWFHDMTDCAPDLRQSFASLGIAGIRRRSDERQNEAKTQSHSSQFHCRTP